MYTRANIEQISKSSPLGYNCITERPKHESINERLNDGLMNLFCIYSVCYAVYRRIRIYVQQFSYFYCTRVPMHLMTFLVSLF
jgi:hypothetical protein